MSFTLTARRTPDADLERLRPDHVIVPELTEPADLERKSAVIRRCARRSAVDELAASRRLPDDPAAVRMVLPERPRRCARCPCRGGAPRGGLADHRGPARRDDSTGDGARAG